MCNSAHLHGHAHAARHSASQHNHVEPASRRDFLRMLTTTALWRLSAGTGLAPGGVGKCRCEWLGHL